MNEKKLSELMEQGAVVLEPHVWDYFDDEQNPKCACAVGCAIYAAGLMPQLISFISLSKVFPEYLWEILWSDVDRATLPADVQEVWQAVSWEQKLIKLIGCVNDNISRERAIQLVKELGY